MSQHEQNVVGELRGLREDLRKRANEPEPVAPIKKPWGTVTSVTRSFGRPIETGSTDVPTGKTPLMLEAEAAQKSRPPVHGQPVEAVTDRVLRVSDDVLKNFGVK